MNEPKQLPTNEYDRLMGQYSGLPGVAKTSPSVVRHVEFTGQTATWIVTTFRHAEQDVPETRVFLEHVDETGARRFVLPPKVVATILKQYDALVTKSRRAGAKKAAETRKERGIEPGFLKGRKKLPRKGPLGHD